MKLLMFASALLLGSNAMALDVFNWTNSDSAFAVASKPSQQEIEGQWMQIGEVDQDRRTDYFPDGWRSYAKGSGKFRSLWTYKFSKSDVYGNPIFELSDTVVDQETNQSVPDDQYTTWNTGKGIDFQSFTTKTAICGARRECRLVQATNMLLCADINDDPKCRGAGTHPFAYFLFVRGLTP